MSKKMNRKLSKVFSDTKRRLSSFTSCKTNKLQNKLDETIECFKKLVQYLEEYDATEIEANSEFREGIKILDDVYIAYKQTVQKLNRNQELASNPFENHPEVFFSSKEIENLKFLKLISAGSFGKIFQINLNKSSSNDCYALRIIPKLSIEKLQNTSLEQEVGSFIEKSCKEKDIGLSGKTCRFIVETFATFESRGYLFFLNEFMEGGSIAFHLERVHHFEEDYVKLCSAQIVHVIEFLQQSFSIKLKRITPENVLLDLNGNCKISNFEYIDIYENQLYNRNDLLTLGYLAYQMLTGNILTIEHFNIVMINQTCTRELNLSAESGVSIEAKQFVQKLTDFLTKQIQASDLNKSTQDIKISRFLKTIDWIELERGELHATFKPNHASFNFKPVETKTISINDLDNLRLNFKNVDIYLANEFPVVNSGVVPDLELLKVIGRGAYGNVFLTKVNNQLYAMKSINKLHVLRECTCNNAIDYTSYLRELFSEKEIGLLSKECRFIARLVHSFQTEPKIAVERRSGIVRGIDDCDSPDDERTSYMFHFMEFLNGGSLEWHLEHKPFTEYEVAFYSAQMLCGILFLHSKQLIHRDIKLANVLLDSNGNAKLCDFSFCARINSNATFTYGTEQFRSPETLIENFLHYSLDFWSFGVCIFNMLTGELPFANEEMLRNDSKMPDLNESREKHRNKGLNLMPSLYFSFRPSSADKISDLACSFVSRLLNKNLDERLGSQENNQDIKSEPFFNCIDWTRLEDGHIQPPIIPNLKSSVDVSSFDQKLTNSKIDVRMVGYDKRLNYLDKISYEKFITTNSELIGI